MTAPDRSTPPPENTTPTASSTSIDQWIMKGLNDLRDDMRDLKWAIKALDGRISAIESKLMKAVYGFGGISLSIVVFWTGFQILTKYIDITVTPKAEITQPSISPP